MLVLLVLSIPVVLGLVLAAAMRSSQHTLLSEPALAAPDPVVPISVLKPLKGLDEDLADNLRTFFEMDYAEYELIFGAADPEDPALDVARGVAREHPRVRTVFVAGESTDIPNPKVANLANMAPHASHDALLISDSNVAVPPHYLADMAARLARPETGLVSSPIRGTGERGLGGALMAYQLNTFVMGGVAGLQRVLRLPCVVGKSMLFTREGLAAVGGFERLGRHLAEDQVCGEEMRASGRAVVLSPVPVDNVLGRHTLGDFVKRHVRWALIRSRMSPAGYAFEGLLNPVLFSLLSAAALGHVLGWAAAGLVLAAQASMGLSAERSLGVRRNPFAYPVLEFLRSLAVGILWPAPLLARSVRWRGVRYRIGRRTLLSGGGSGSAGAPPGPEGDSAAR